MEPRTITPDHIRRVLSVIATTLSLGWRLVIYFAAGVAAGIANGIAGGGTFITFPTMLALGVTPVTANVTSSVGVLPSYVGGIAKFRAELQSRRSILKSLIPACLLGTGLGAALLLLGHPNTFRSVIPWLIGAATVIFGLSPLITRRLSHLDHNHPTRRILLQVGVFLVAMYGGYFGAGLGIMLIAVLSVALPDDLDTLHGLRNATSFLINVIAAVIFLARATLDWEAVPMLLIGTAIGGWLGAILIKRLQPTTVRIVIVAIGAATTIRLAV